MTTGAGEPLERRQRFNTKTDVCQTSAATISTITAATSGDTKEVLVVVTSALILDSRSVNSPAVCRIAAPEYATNASGSEATTPPMLSAKKPMFTGSESIRDRPPDFLDADLPDLDGFMSATSSFLRASASCPTGP